jgi:hypothetical protein
MTAHRQTHRLKPVRLVKRGTTPTPLAKWRDGKKKEKEKKAGKQRNNKAREGEVK